jgi:uncharacterized membrane protein
MGIGVTIDTAAPTVARGAAGRVLRRHALHGLILGVLAAAMAAGYSVFAWFRFYTFKSSSYDLVIFDEAVRSYAHFRPGISVVKGLHNGFGPNFSVLGDHWSPIIALLAPLYWVFHSPVTLLVAQAALFALAIPPLWLFTRRAFGGGPKATAAAYLVAVAYAVSWPIASAAAFDFHEAAFAPVLMAVAVERLQAGRLRTALLALAGLLLVKEDMGLFVAGAGIVLAVSRPMVNRQRLVALVLVVVGLADTAVATYVLIPAFGGRSNYYWAYSSLGNNVPQVLAHMVAHPLSSLRVLVTPRVKLDTMVWLFGAFCFLPLLSPWTLALIPLLAERMLASKFPNWWVTSYQYNACLVAVLVCAAVDGAARLDRWAVAVWRGVTGGQSRTAVTAPRSAAGRRTGQPADATVSRAAADGGAVAPAEAEDGAAAAADAAAGDAGATDAAAGLPAARAGDNTAGEGAGRPADAGPDRAARGALGRGTVALLCAVAMLAVGLYLVPRGQLGTAFHRSFYHRTAQMQVAAAAVAAVPAGVTVEASNYLGPHLSGRDTVLLWDLQGPRWAPWVVADTASRQFTFPSVRAQKERIALLERSGYQVVFHQRGYIVLHRVSVPAGSPRTMNYPAGG